MFWTIGAVLLVLVLSCLKQVNQWERGVVFTMGRYSYTMSPGWRLLLPIFQTFKKVDIRIKAVD
ncbi:MAG: SPFH domain-containing protein, partial [Patescibacteria group bacterium]|nr:SPFH domain-containing protein [Patescibacteria group bacterium]